MRIHGHGIGTEIIFHVDGGPDVTGTITKLQVVGEIVGDEDQRQAAYSVAVTGGGAPQLVLESDIVPE